MHERTIMSKLTLASLAERVEALEAAARNQGTLPPLPVEEVAFPGTIIEDQGEIPEGDTQPPADPAQV
jgi:hypothetical protein